MNYNQTNKTPPPGERVYERGFRYFKNGEEYVHRFRGNGMKTYYDYWIKRKEAKIHLDPIAKAKWEAYRKKCREDNDPSSFISKVEYQKIRRQLDRIARFDDRGLDSGVLDEKPIWFHNADGSDDFFYDAEDRQDEVDRPQYTVWHDAQEYWEDPLPELIAQGDTDSEEEEEDPNAAFWEVNYPEEWKPRYKEFEAVKVDNTFFCAGVKTNFVHCDSGSEVYETEWPFHFEDLEKIMAFLLRNSDFWQQKWKNWVAEFGEERLEDIFSAFVINASFTKAWICKWREEFFKDEQTIDAFIKHVESYSLSAQGEDNLEAAGGTESTANMTFVDERPTDFDSTHTGGEVATKDPNMDMSERDWKLNEVLTRWIIVHQGTWSSQAAHAILKDLPIPKCITDKKQSMTTSQLRLFGFGHFGVKLRIQLNGTKFHCGRLICCLFPLMWEEDDAYYDVQNWTCFPHVFLDASVNNSGELYVPFTHMLSHFPLRAGSLESDSICSLGRLRIAVFNALRLGEGSSSDLDFTVYAKFDTPEMHQTTWPIEEFSFSNGLVTQGGDEGFFKGIFSRGLSTALGSFLSTMTGGLATGIGGVLSGLIFDKPIDPMPAAPIINRSVNAPCHGAGLDTGVRLSLSPVSQTETNVGQLGGTTGDFNLLTLCKMPCLLFTREWTSTLGPGGLLARIPVNPCYLPPNRVEVQANASVGYSPTMLAYVSRAHVYRRGDIMVKIQVIGTAFHDGRLMIVYDPTWTAASPPPEDLDHLMNLNTIVMDVAEQQEMEIQIPYMSVRPWLRCDAFRDDDNYKPTQDKIEGERLGMCTNGMLYIFVLNRLVAPSNVAQDVDVNIFWYAGNDYELAVPCPLAPLSLLPPASIDKYGELEEYPWKIPPAVLQPVEIDNREKIVNLYFEGRRLFELGKITKGVGSDKWWNYTRVVGWGNDTETITWCYEASILNSYESGPQLVLMASMPPYKPMLTTQGKPEEYTTTRNNELPAVCITKSYANKEVAPSTVSENAMNLQTQLRRYYPLLVAYPIFNKVGFTLISVPVKPTSVPAAEKPIGKYAEPVEVNNLTWFTRLYTYHRGSWRVLFVCSDTGREVYMWYNPSECHKFSIKSGYKEVDVQRNMCFAGNIAVTHLEGSMQVEIPFHSPYNQLLNDVHGKYNDLRCQNGTLFIAVRNGRNDEKTESSFTFSLFASTGDDFVLNILRPPPAVFEPQKVYSDCTGANPLRVKKPEIFRNLGDDSQKMVVPGTTGVKALNDKGSIQYCEVATTGLVAQGWPFGISETKQRIDDCLDNTTALLQQIQTTNVFGNLSEMTLKLDGVVTTMTENAQHLPERIQAAASDTLTKYAVLTGEVMMCGAVLYSVRACLTEPSVSHLIALAISIAGMVGMVVSTTLHDLVRGVVDWVLNFNPGLAQAQALDGAVADAIESSAGKIAAVVAVLGTVLYSYIFGVIPPLKKITAAIRTFFEGELDAQGMAQDLGIDLRSAHFAVMGISALDKVYTKMAEWTRRFIDWMLDKENPEVIAARTSDAYKDRILAVITELDELEYEPVFIEALSSPMVHNRFYKLMTEVMDLTKASLHEKLDSRVTTLITECRKRAQKLIQRYEKDNPTPMTRYDPYVICLQGRTGTGKSHIMNKIARIVQEVMQLPEYNLIYTKNIEDKFWSRYTNQPIIFWDEFGQNRDADKTVIPQFMTLRSRAPVALQLAESQDKGRPFTSQCIIMATNSCYTRYNSIRDNSAFMRRRQMIIRMEHREGFNVEQMQQAAHDAFPNYEHCQFTRTQYEEDRPWADFPNTVTWPEMAEHIRTEVRRWHDNQMAALVGEVAVELPRGVVMMEAPDRPEGYVDPDEVVLDHQQLEQELEGVAIPLLDAAAREHLNGEIVLELDDGGDLVGRNNLGHQVPLVRAGEQVVALLPGVRNAQDGGHVEIEEEDEEFEDAGEDLVAEGMDGEPYIDPAVIRTMKDPAAHGIHIRYIVRKAVGMELTEDEDFAAELYIEQLKRAGAATKRAIINKAHQAKAGASKLKDLATRLFTRLGNVVIDFYNNNPKIAKVLGLLTLLGGVALATAAIRGSDKQEEGVYESGPMSRPNPRVKIAESVYESGPTAKPSSRVKIAEGCEDPVAMDIKNVVHPQIYNIRWCDDASRLMSMRCLHIGGHTILAPYHFFRHASAGDKLELLHRYHPTTIEYVPAQLKRIREYDWAVYYCGPRLEPGKKLTKYFVKEANLDKLNKIDNAYLLSVTKEGDKCSQMGAVTASKRFSYRDEKYGDVYEQKGWKTPFPTVSGDCGSVLLAATARAEPPGKIVGIHVAGRQGYNEGYSILITRELLEEALFEVEPQLAPAIVSCGAIDKARNPITDCRVIPKGDYTIFGVMPNSKAPAQPVGTSFVKTPFYEEVCKDMPEPKKPANLKPFYSPDGTRISPLRLALEKYGEKTLPFPKRSMDKVEHFLKHYLKNQLKNHTGKRVWSVNEAVNGIPGTEYADRMNMRSSPGWPYQVINKKETGKAYLFDDDGNIVDPLLKHLLEERVEAAKKCERVQSVWRDCLKDELRPVAKVDQGKTRLFNIAPVDFTIAVRQYMMDFIMAFYSKNTDDFFSTVGINPESYEWTKLYDYLAEVGTDCVAGDFKGYDGTIPPELIMMVCRIINYWYGDSEENQNVRYTLFLEIVHTMQLCENCVYCSHQGNPSGNPLTVILNTIVNLIYMLLAWIEVYPDKTIEDFFTFCRIVAYGDDNCITVHPSCHDYNQQSIARFLAKFGITYTTETKDSSDPKFRHLNTITFLKRGFRKDAEFGGSFQLPVMSEETLNSYFYYFRKSDDVEEQLRENMRAALSFAAFRGKDYYEAFNAKWISLMEKSNYRPLYISHAEQVDNFLASAGAGGVKLEPQIFKRVTSPMTTEGMEKFMNITNNKIARTVLGLVEAPVYYLCALLGIGAVESEFPRTDRRWAVSIPSGEGKSYLAKKYPHVFVDHDELLLPHFSNTSKRDMLKNGLPWSPAIARQYDFPPEDRRILLVHHPDNTNRQMIGSVITHFPTFIRTNIFQRLTQPKPMKMHRNERNTMLLAAAQKLEPQLFEE